MVMQTLTLEAVEELATEALLSSGASPNNAVTVAQSVMAAEADGLRSHGLSRLPTYMDHVRIGKVDGKATPSFTRPSAAVVSADAACGFAHPAIAPGLTYVANAARENGVAALAVRNSYNCGVVGHHVEALAHAGLVGIAFVNAPPSIAPWGGTRPLFGTNPIAFAAPRRNGDPIIVDQSSSVIARGEILVHSQLGKPLQEGWALDVDGHPTTDAKLALQGSLLPSGGYKGSNMALMIDLLAGALLGTHIGIEASSFGGNDGGPPRTGQLFLALNPGAFAEVDAFWHRTELLIEAILGQPGTHIPGAARAERRARARQDGVLVPEELIKQIQQKMNG